VGYCEDDEDRQAFILPFAELAEGVLRRTDHTGRADGGVRGSGRRRDFTRFGGYLAVLRLPAYRRPLLGKSASRVRADSAAAPLRTAPDSAARPPNVAAGAVGFGICQADSSTIQSGGHVD
jgi:hypothetical protein